MRTACWRPSFSVLQHAEELMHVGHAGSSGRAARRRCAVRRSRLGVALDGASTSNGLATGRPTRGRRPASDRHRDWRPARRCTLWTASPASSKNCRLRRISSPSRFSTAKPCAQTFGKDAQVDVLAEHHGVVLAGDDLVVDADLLVHRAFVAGQRHDLADRLERRSADR